MSAKTNSNLVEMETRAQVNLINLIKINNNNFASGHPLQVRRQLLVLACRPLNRLQPPIGFVQSPDHHIAGVPRTTTRWRSGCLARLVHAPNVSEAWSARQP